MLNDQLALIKDRLSNYTPKELPEFMSKQLKISGVLVPILIESGELKLIVTKRAGNLKHHGGESSFPGGRMDDSDKTILDCALRETWEEIGLPADKIEIIGRLDETPVISGHRIEPFVGFIAEPYEFVKSEAEIDYIFSVPIDQLTDPENHTVRPSIYMDHEIAIHFYQVMGETIWGATGRIVTNLLDVCFDYQPPDYLKFLAEDPERV